MLLMTFLTSVAYDPWSASQASVGRWLVLAAATAACLWGVRLRPGVGHWLGLAFAAYAAASVLWAPSPLDGVHHAAEVALLGAVFCCGAAATEYRRGVATGLGLACLVQATFLLAQLDGLELVMRAYGSLRPGLFLNRDTAAEFGVASLILLAMLQMWIWVPAAAVCAFLPGSHAAYVALGVAATLWALPRVSAAAKGTILIALPLVVVALILYEWSPGAPVDRVGTRLEYWQAVIPWITLFGRGAGSLAALFPNLEYAHDEYAQLAFEYGAGALFLAALLVRALLSGPEPERLALVALLVCALTWAPFHFPASAMLVALLAGRLCGERDRVLRARRAGGVPGLGRVPRRWGLGGGRDPGEAEPRRADVPVRPEPAVCARGVLAKYREGVEAA